MIRLKPPVAAWSFTIGRIILGSVFLWACWDKIIHPEAFALAIANYQIVPEQIANIGALILPWVELACGISLVINRWAHGGALIAAALMLVFMGALGYNMFRGIDVNCGCFTLDEQAPGNMWLYLIRDIIFLSLAVVVMRRPSLASGPDGTD